MATGEGLTLHLERTVPASPAEVFAACVEPEKLAEWWGPAGFTSPSVELDLRVGGRYRITMQPPDGDAFHLRGEFREVEPPRRVVYTFEWEEPDPDDRETVAELSFVDDPEGTRVVLD
ncbi:MAG TPA: SRPBCC domain-containing protein [Gaiellaceae bacterium]|nr:SRPBCC domain-containing protein [Gaiellaceae bacterium]